MPTSLDIDETVIQNHEQNSYPIRVGLMSFVGVEASKMMNGDTPVQNAQEVIEAKYLLGCDGAHSWVRKRLGLKLEGASRDVDWGVLDAFPVTDFRESHFTHLPILHPPPHLFGRWYQDIMCSC